MNKVLKVSKKKKKVLNDNIIIFFIFVVIVINLWSKKPIRNIKIFYWNKRTKRDSKYWWEENFNEEHGDNIDWDGVD